MRGRASAVFVRGVVPVGGETSWSWRSETTNVPLPERGAGGKRDQLRIKLACLVRPAGRSARASTPLPTTSVFTPQFAAVFNATLVTTRRDGGTCWALEVRPTSRFAA